MAEFLKFNGGLIRISAIESVTIERNSGRFESAGQYYVRVRTGEITYETSYIQWDEADKIVNNLSLRLKVAG